MTLSHLSQSSKNVAINAQYRQPAGDFKQYKTYLESFFNKLKNSGEHKS